MIYRTEPIMISQTDVMPKNPSLNNVFLNINYFFLKHAHLQLQAIKTVPICVESDLDGLTHLSPAGQPAK